MKETVTICPLCGHQHSGAAIVCASCGEGGREENPSSPAFLARVPQHTRRFVAVFYTLNVLCGFTAAQGWDSASFLMSIAAGLTISWWVITDASDRSRPMRFVVRLLVILVGGLAAVVYLIVSRRLRGVGWLLINAIAYAAAVWISFELGLLPYRVSDIPTAPQQIEPPPPLPPIEAGRSPERHISAV